MADEPTNPVIEEEVVTPAETPEPEAQDDVTLAQPTGNEPEVPEDEVVEDDEEEVPPPPSRREQLRIQSLLKKYGDPRQPSPAPSQAPNRLDYNTALEADPEVVRQLEADRQSVAQSQFLAGQQEGLRRAEFLDWKTSLKIEAPVIEKKYPILDKNSPDFHPAVADAMNTWYLKMSGFDPDTQTVNNNSISYADFVESNMELVEEIAGQKNAQTVKNITQQAAATGLRPDGSSAKRLNLNQAPEDMTLEELYAKIGQKPPKK